VLIFILKNCQKVVHEMLVTTEKKQVESTGEQDKGPQRGDISGDLQVKFTTLGFKLRCDKHFTHPFTALLCVFRVEIAKHCFFQ